MITWCVLSKIYVLHTAVEVLVSVSGYMTVAAPYR